MDQIVDSGEEMNPDRNLEIAWERVLKTQVPLYSSGYKVGGYPDFTWGKEIADWPHVLDVEGNYIPLKFLAQIVLPSQEVAYVYIDTDSRFIKDMIKWADPEDGSTAVLRLNHPAPSWVKMTPTFLNPDLVHSPELAVTTDISKLPKEPYWVQYEETIPENAPYFFTIISDGINDTTTYINEDMITYIFWDKKDTILAFGKMW